MHGKSRHKEAAFHFDLHLIDCVEAWPRNIFGGEALLIDSLFIQAPHPSCLNLGKFDDFETIGPAPRHGLTNNQLRKQSGG